MSLHGDGICQASGGERIHRRRIVIGEPSEITCLQHCLSLMDGGCKFGGGFLCVTATGQ